MSADIQLSAPLGIGSVGAAEGRKVALLPTCAVTRRNRCDVYEERRVEGRLAAAQCRADRAGSQEL